MEYEINGKEISYFSMVVEAENEDEAYEVAQQKWAEGMANYGDIELSDLEVTASFGEVK